MTYVIEVSGNKEVAAKLQSFGVAVLDLTRSMDETGRYLTGFFSGEVFASRGGVIGKPWAPLSPAYAAQKAREFPGRIPLVRTGLMIRSFKYKAAKLSASIFNDSPVFEFHQLGTSRMPARVMMDIDQQRERRVVQFVADDIDLKMRQTDV